MRPLFGNEAVQPTWGLVSDMNEFRLYWRNTIPSQYQRFIINRSAIGDGVSLLDKTPDGSFQRFLFVRLFESNSLITKGGPPLLLQLLKQQRYQEREIENTFYKEYRAYREYLISLLIEHNPTFSGTKGKLVRLAQKIIDRCIFVMFCEDMGEQLNFPPNALRDYLAELSKNSTFEPLESDAWNKLKELFSAMSDGKIFRSRNLNRFNGGLFAQDEELEGLSIPNTAFCTKFQGENDDTLKASRLTLLYFSGTYNFSTGKHDGKAITPFTLGRIFEQSITELEALEAEVEDRESLTVLSKRKRDGVFYTPEWVVERVVADTLGSRLDDIRRELGWNLSLEGDEAAIRTQVKLPPSKRSAAFVRHATAVQLVKQRLETFTVLDPACGSGAFLIHTLEYLLRERRRVERELALVTGGGGTDLFEFKSDEAVRSILSANIFGVDINPASVEIARLALWLHTAKAKQPLTNLDENIVTGNSLVGREVYEFKEDLITATQAKRETINAFNFDESFPTVFAADQPDGKGFDCIVGNPPYVKLQNFKKVYPETADYLKNAKGTDGLPLYRSCQSGSFDLYLPFIEHGISLLNDGGRLGYIAPSVWRYNSYGRALRQFIKQRRALDRWADFGSFQVFNEATTYTALQFYSKSPNKHVQIALAPDGALGNIPDWDDPAWRLDYSAIPDRDPWVFASQPTLKLLAKLKKTCPRLGAPQITSAISQGLVSGAFDIFASDRVSTGRYRSVVDGVAQIVELEDEVALPLISASDIDRFTIHPTSLAIIFPYDLTGSQPVFVGEKQFQAKYPKAFRHLETHEKKLRKRDAGQFLVGGDQEEQWYAYSRNQNLEKQSLPKIVIAGTAMQIEAAIDANGAFATNDKRVYSVFPQDLADIRYLTGVLNSRVVSFVFRQFARPKANGYFDIESQFLDPLPIPKANAQEKTDVALCVDRLTKAHNDYAELRRDMDRRLAACSVEQKSAEWLWPAQVGTMAALKLKAASDLTPNAKTKWARAERDKQIATQVELLGSRLLPDSPLYVTLAKGELCITSGPDPLLNGVFVEDHEAELALISWRQFIRRQPVADAASLVQGLLRINVTSNNAIRTQLAALDNEALVLEQEIALQENRLNQLAYRLFRLTPGEIELVERGR